ncbi:MAG: HpcH/HpaI aldolase/citrate lyase family protein [Halopseudomonas aestusnigri]
MTNFKSRLQLDQTLYGLWSTLSSPNVAELIGGAGFDWLLFDSEHAPIELADLVSLLRAADRSPSALAVRISWNDEVLIKRVLDLGVQNLFIPFVENADEAQKAVQATRYPPNGKRGLAGATRASSYGRNRNYIEQASENICLIGQIETPEAVENIAEIAAVDGLDGVFIGPSDLSASMGYPGRADHPEVQGMIRNCAEQLNQLGKPAGILAPDELVARRYAKWGYRFIAAGVDASLLVRATDNLLKELLK